MKERFIFKGILIPLFFANAFCVSNHPLLLIVSFDGFRYDYTDKYNTPYLDSLATAGVKARWMTPCFTSKTFPNHHSIATGLYEESHGIVANAFYDPIINDVFSVADTGAEWWDTGAIPIWILNQEGATDRHSGGMMWAGTNARIRGQTASTYTNYDGSMSWYTRVDTVIEWFTREVDPVNLALIYYDQPDGAGHDFGPDSPEVRSQVELVDAYVGYLVQKLVESGLNINLVIVSDHGMAPVPEENVIEMDNIIIPTTYTSYGSSPIWNIEPNPGYSVDYIYNTLKAASQTHAFQVYKKQDIPAEYHYQNNIRISSILLVANETYDIEHTKWTYPTNVHGNHGYNNQAETMKAIFYAQGPAFKRNLVIDPINNIDLFSLFSEILDLTPAPNNGTFAHVEAALQNPPRRKSFKGYVKHGRSQ